MITRAPPRKDVSWRVRSAQAASVLSVADSSTITSVQANTSGVEMVILAR